MTSRVALDVLESVYASSANEDAWHASVAETVLRAVRAEHGSVSAFVDWTPRGVPTTYGWRKNGGASEDLLRFAMDQHDARILGTDAPTPIAMVYARGSYLCGTRERLGDAFDALEVTTGRADERTGHADSINLVCMDASLRGLVLIHPSTTRVRTHPRTRELWSRVAAHVTAGLRLRRVVKGESLEADADVILDTAGHVLEAKANAIADREVLREAAKRVDRARLRGTEEDEALDLWQCLFSGEYSVVDCFDTDGKRLFVARRNPPQARGPRMLTDRERHVVALIGVGHSDKSAAYELGISEGTVASHLHVALRKLGLPSASDLGLLRARTHEVGERTERER